jgi:serine protease Do
LIGIVNAKSGGTNIEGIGFAIPSVMAKSVADQLIANGYVLGRVDFGVSLVEITDTFTAMRYGLNALGVFVQKDDADTDLKSGDTLALVVSHTGKDYSASITLKQLK